MKKSIKMKSISIKRIFLLLSLFFILCVTLFAESPFPSANSTNLISIVHPYEYEEIPALDRTFVYGSVPPEGKLKINGEPVPVHPGGGFITMVKLEPGEFQIKAELQLGNEVYHSTRTIIVAEPEKIPPVTPLTIQHVTPEHDQELLPGDYVEVTCKGSPGAEAYFTIEGVRGKIRMAETHPEQSGIYRGIYQIAEKDRLKKSKIKVTLINKRITHGKTTVSQKAGGTLSRFPNNPPVMVEITSPNVILRAGPALTSGERAGYLMFPPIGTVLKVTGRIGDEYRVNLTKTKTVWVNAGQVKRLPPGTPPARIPVNSVSVSESQHSTLIHIPLQRKIPFHPDPDVKGEYLDLTLYGAFSNTDWITNLAAGCIKSLNWYQDEEEAYRLRINTNPDSWWGYDARYEGNSLVIQLRTPPPVAAGNSPLSGLKIAVDAGHGTGGGALGPTGLAEGDANFAQAINLKEKLLAKGAEVIMLRPGKEDLALSARTQTAWWHRADILISLHNNGLDYSVNPFTKHGFGVYYFTPMSLPLAKEIHTAYREAFPVGGAYDLPDDGLHYANLAMTRKPQMPSVLIESAYMNLPAEEAYLKSDDFLSACSRAIIAGLERYVRRMRPVMKRQGDRDLSDSSF